MNALMNVFNKYFGAKTIDDDNVYIQCGVFQREVVSKLPLTSKSSNSRKKFIGQISLDEVISKFNLSYKIVTKKGGRITNISIDQYKQQQQKYMLYVKLADIIARDDIISFIRKKYNISDQTPNILPTSPVQQNVSTQEQKQNGPIQEQNDPHMLYLNDEPCPIIQLEDHKVFRDQNGNRISIEYRGERSYTKCFANAIDIEQAFEINQFTQNLFQKDIWEEGIDYVVLEYGNKSDAPKSHCAYLTFYGIIKAAFNERKDNGFRYQYANWIVKTIFTHQMGSQDEREILANELALFNKFCLNKLQGTYLVRIGKIKDLRESMDISYDDYSTDFDSAYMYKYGRGDIMARYKKHIKTYGYYSNKIQMNWFAILPEGKDIDAESSLSNYFIDRNLKFQFIDHKGIERKELIVLKNDELKEVNNKYLSLIAKYPSAENEIAMILDKARSEYEKELAQKDAIIAQKELMIAEEKGLREIAEQTIIVNEERYLRKLDNERHLRELTEHKLQSTTENLQLRLEIAQLKLEAKA